MPVCQRVVGNSALMIKTCSMVALLAGCFVMVQNFKFEKMMLAA
jgi:hypothetical protein